MCRTKCKTRHPSRRRKTGFRVQKYLILNIQRRYCHTPGKHLKKRNLAVKRWTKKMAGKQCQTGLAGVRCILGITGAQGLPGPAGVQGAQGVPGPAGLQGIPGSTGLRGPIGAQGITGPTGPQGVTGPSGPAPNISDIEIIPTSERYFYTAPDDIESSVTIRADQFSADGVHEAFQRFYVGPNSYANLYINGMIQESTLYSLTPALLTIHLSEGESILSGTPIIVEIVQFSVRYSA